LESAQNENNVFEQSTRLDNTGDVTGNGADFDVGTQNQDGQSGDIQQSVDTGSEADDDDSLQSQQSEDEENGDATTDDTEDNDGTTFDDAEDNDGDESVS
jgi:hypothetical protein